MYGCSSGISIKHLSEGYHLEFYKRYYLAHTQYGFHKVEPSVFVKTVWFKGYVMLFFTNRSVHFLPFRCLESVEQVEQLKALLTQYKAIASSEATTYQS
jgi:hypothetical protein